jgi:hypothetical protein
MMNVKPMDALVPSAATNLEDWLIRDLIDAYPQTIDLCCGGGHSLGEALDLHGIDRETVLPRIASIIAGSALGEA